MHRCVPLLVVILSLACAAQEAPPAPSSPEVGGDALDGAKRLKRAKSPRVPGAQTKIPTSGVPDPLAGLSDRDLCAGTPAQLMLKYELGALQNGQCHDVCCPLDSGHWCCELDFPFSDVPPCDAWAMMRNEIFARYGYPFKDQRWRDEFEGEPWYHRREDFDAGWLSKMAAGNIATLKEYETQQIGCMNP